MYHAHDRMEILIRLLEMVSHLIRGRSDGVLTAPID